VLRITQFSKTYKGGKKAVDDLSLHIAPGDVFGFIGHNGAGKTTTLKACAGILDFDAGEILIEGRSIKAEPVACKQGMAFLPDEPMLYPYLTGIQYLNFICDIYRVDGETRKRRITYYAALLEIEADLGNLISAYSHGMKQKLALVSALAHEPRLLMLDEPFVGLDPKVAFTVKQIFSDFCREGRAIFFSTHVLDVAEKLCNKVAIIKAGKLAACGNMDEIRGDRSLETIFMELSENA